MKAALLYIKSFLLVACVLTEGALPLILPEKYSVHVVAEGEKEAETSYKKEELKGGEKQIARHLLSLSHQAKLLKCRLFNHQNLVSAQTYLPILTPPPEAAG